MSKQENQELEERTYEALVKAASVLSIAELSILCYNCGIPSRDVVEAVQRDWEPQQRDGYLEGQIEAAEARVER